MIDELKGIRQTMKKKFDLQGKDPENIKIFQIPDPI